MLGNYVPSNSTQNFVFKNPSNDPTNLRYAAVKPSHAESAFKNLMYSPSGRPASKTKKKPKTGISSSYHSSGHKNSALMGTVSKKLMPSYYGRKSDNSRSSSYNKRPKSGSKLSNRTQRSSSGTLKSTKGSLGSTSKTKFGAAKGLNKYASVDAFMDASKTLRPFKISSKQSKNSSVDGLFKGSQPRGLKYSYSSKGMPSNLKIKKDRTKLKKKKTKLEKGDYVKKLGINTSSKFKYWYILATKEGEKAPSSINIINTNHLHFSGYPNQSSLNNSGGVDAGKKDNYDSIVKKFKPEKSRKKGVPVSGAPSQEKRMKLKQEIKTTKPKKSTLRNSGSSKKMTPNTSKRENSEVRKAEPVIEKKEKTAKRSQSQPPVGEPPQIQSNLEDYVDNYAFQTRTGMIPDKPDKQNQDIYFITPNFASIKNNWFFGVWDGHGVNGHFASDHVKQYLPQNIELLDYMLMMQRQKESEKTPEEKKEGNSGFFEDDEEDLTTYLLSKDHKKKYTVISEGFIKTACDIQNRSFNVDYSGTTVVTVMLSGNQLTCANLGDSRAVLGSIRSKEDAETINKNTTEIKMESVAGPDSSGEKMWISTSLSLDHKPDRADEFQRIMESNGRVDPFREDNGEPVGPARVWLKEANVPGLAMSRSMGDLVAGSVGVIPEPEFFELVLSSPDKFLVIASDGVWEFIDNDECVRLVAPYWEKNDPQGACDKLTALSVEHWQREDEVIDDITVVVVFLKIPPTATT